MISTIQIELTPRIIISSSKRRKNIFQRWGFLKTCCISSEYSPMLFRNLLYASRCSLLRLSSFIRRMSLFSLWTFLFSAESVECLFSGSLPKTLILFSFMDCAYFFALSAEAAFQPCATSSMALSEEVMIRLPSSFVVTFPIIWRS